MVISFCNLLKMRKDEGCLKEDKTFQSTVTFTVNTTFFYATQNSGHQKLVAIKDHGHIQFFQQTWCLKKLPPFAQKLVVFNLRGVLSVLLARGKECEFRKGWLGVESNVCSKQSGSFMIWRSTLIKWFSTITEAYPSLPSSSSFLAQTSSLAINISIIWPWASKDGYTHLGNRQEV